MQTPPRSHRNLKRREGVKTGYKKIRAFAIWQTMLSPDSVRMNALESLSSQLAHKHHITEKLQTFSHRLNTPFRYSTISDPPSLLSP